MTNLDQLKQELAELTEKVNAFSTTTTTGEYVFTKEQMVTFVKELHSQFTEKVESDLEGLEIDTENISLELSYDNRIEITYDGDIHSSAVDCISYYDNDEIETTIDDLYSRVKEA